MMRAGALLTVAVAVLILFVENRSAQLVLTASPLPGNAFTVSCGFSHRNTDDLIRFPRKPGASHNHTYVGNRSANARSTLSTLRAATTTCDRPADTSAYWMPTLYANGKPLAPDGAKAYYRRATASAVVPFPPGFRMIAGTVATMTHGAGHSMTMPPQHLEVVSWECRGGGAAATRPTAMAQRCTPRQRLVLRVSFPSCWDGRSRDSTDHKSHVDYPVRGQCPRRRPVALPALTLEYQFPAIPRRTVLELASGGQGSGHADFVNSWKQSVLSQLVDQCLNEACGRGQVLLPE